MRWYHYVAYFFGGAFLANALPHLGNGISGHAFSEPFRIAARRRLVLFDGQRRMGSLQPYHRLPNWSAVSATSICARPSTACAWGGHPCHVPDAGPRIRTVPRGTVSRFLLNPADR